MFRLSLKDFLIYFFLFFVLNILLLTSLGFVYSLHEELDYQGMIFIVIESILSFYNQLGTLFSQNQDSIFLNYFLSIVILSVFFTLITNLFIKFLKK